MRSSQSRTEVQAAFARSLAMLWEVLTAVVAIGAVASLFMRGILLSHTLDPSWAIKHRDKEWDQEVGATHRTEEKAQAPCAALV